MIPIFVQSFKGSKKLNIIKSRLKQLKLKYKIIYSLNLTKFNKKIFKNNFYNNQKARRILGREMSGTEIACAYGHIKIYKYIIKNKIPRAIIFEDDAWPKNNFVNLYNKNFKYKFTDILVFASTSGYIEKKGTNFRQYKIHKYISHFNGTGAYSINLKTCKKIINETNGIVSNVPDWPINLIKNNIKSVIILPTIVKLIKQNSSYLQKDRKKLVKDYSIKKIIPNFILNILLIVYYLLYIPYFLKRYPDLDFYKEHFVNKKIIIIKNFFTRNYLDIEKLYYNKKNS
jgi:GR25 family glycosyltransferase involved in LPS biosynthesis